MSIDMEVEVSTFPPAKEKKPPRKPNDFGQFLDFLIEQLKREMGMIEDLELPFTYLDQKARLREMQKLANTAGQSYLEKTRWAHLELAQEMERNPDAFVRMLGVALKTGNYTWVTHNEELPW